MNDPVQTPMCRRFERNLYHYQAGELARTEARALSDHASDCQRCARLLEVEDAFLRGLKSRLSRVVAPSELRERVEEALASQVPSRRALSWLRRPWLVPAAAGLLLAALLIPGMPRWASVVQIEREVTVVDIDCEAAGRTLQQQRHCTHPLHLNALKTGPDQYWNISLDDGVGRRLVADRDMRGQRLVVVGDLYTRIRTLHVTGYTEQEPPADLTAAFVP